MRNFFGNTIGTIKRLGGSSEKWATEAKKIANKKNIDDLQMLMDLAGMFPGYGAVADLINAIISLLRGDLTGALFSAFGAIPVAGDAAKGAKIIKNVDSYIAAIGRVQRNVISRLPAPIANKLQRAMNALENELKAYKKIHPQAPKPKITPKKPTSTNPKSKQTKRTKPDRQTRKKLEDKKRRGNQGKANNNQKASGKKQKDSKSKPKKKMKCGDNGTYKDLKKTTGENKYDRDHIPSKASLKKRAVQLNRDRKLTSKQATAIEDAGLAISIPKKAHKEVSPTYGRKNNTSTRITEDAGDLAKAAQRDIDAMEKEIDKYEPGCKKFYQKAAKKILAMTNADYDKLLKEILKNPNLK
jgi:hypothetical protein